MTIAGSLFGLAFGDAMGKPTEFAKFETLKKAYSSGWLDELPVKNGIAKVTDDTQMAMSVGLAVTSAAETGFLDVLNVTWWLEQEFINWYNSPDNTADRAPGTACLTACARLNKGKPWWEATKDDAKGCGANMRVTPIGLCNWLTGEQRSGIAQLQAAITHWHPTALAASDVTQEAVHLLLNGADPTDLLDLLLDYIGIASKWGTREWIGDLLDDGGRPTGREGVDKWMGKGWFETRQAILKVKKAWQSPRKIDRKADPCKTGGEGWVAEQALATALHCFLMFPNDGARVVARAAATGGDSDSIAALAGAFAGASKGMRTFPSEWTDQIEYRTQLSELATRLS